MENNKPQLPLLGLYTDSERISQPDGSYPFALNALHDSESGSKGSLVNEHSNQLCVTLDGNIKGWINLDRNETVYFTDNNSIYSVKECVATQLVNNPSFNFNYTITGEHKVLNGCEKVIYWCDGVNPDRYYNISKPDRFTSIDDFSLLPNITHPCITTTVNDFGGRLEYGSYSFVLELLDSTLNVIYRSIPTQSVSIGENLNIDTYTAEVGGKNPSNQSIKLDIENLDDQTKFFRVGVISLTSGDGITRTAHYVGSVYPVGTSTIIYPGYNPSNGDTLVDADELLKSIASYETSKVMEQVHGRLIRHNLKEQSVDYSTYQSYASRITVTPAIQKVLPENLEDQLTEQGDEIKAYSIVYLHKSGRLSPPFHIPGRAYEESDGDNWLRDNTGSLTKMGYHECDSTYTNPINFCGTDYWGEDLLNSKVRHHRIPSRDKIPLMDEDGYINLIGVQFDNIEYPDDTIVGHFFLSSEYTPFNRTVVASGYMIPYNFDGDSTGDKIEGRYINYLPNSADKERQSNTVYQNFVSLEYLTTLKPVTGEYVRINGYLNTDYDDNRPKYNKYFKDKNRLQLYGKHHTTTTFTSDDEMLDISDSISLLYQSQFNDIPNRSLSSNFNILTLEDNPDVFNSNRANLNYSYVKNSINPHCNINSIRYRLMHTCPLTGETNTLFSGDCYISSIDLTNLSRITTEDDDRFGLLFIPIFGPTAFLTSSLLDRDEIRLEYEWISKLYFESPLNFNRRIKGTDVCNAYYDPSTEIDAYIMGRISIKGTDEKMTLRDSFCNEWWSYNPDYTPSHQRIFYPLSLTFDYCSSCLNHYPTRRVWSDVSTEESDTWRIYKPLNYSDLPGHRGQIIGSDYHNGHLITRCEHGMFLEQPDPQQLETSGATVRLGTGGFLSIPPIEMNDSEIGTAGQQNVLAKVKFPGGLAWVDQEYGSVYLKSDKINELAQNGMDHFFIKNLPSSMKEFLQDDYDPDMFPVILTYDPIFDRLILHKKDFYPLNSSITYNDGKFYLNSTELDLADSKYFENRSFTISYSLQTNSWISFHSYQPDLFTFNTNGINSILGDQIWSHNNYNTFTTFFDIPFDFIIEIVDKDFMTYNTHGFYYIASSQQYDTDHKVWKDVLNKTFTQALFYTKIQSTGVFSLRYNTGGDEDNLFWSNDTKPVTQTDRNYKISQIRDLAVSLPVNTENWDYRKQVFIDGQGYIDHVPLLDNLNYDKEQYDLNEFRDKWICARLYFKENDTKLTVHLFEVNKFVSNR